MAAVQQYGGGGTSPGNSSTGAGGSYGGYYGNDAAGSSSGGGASGIGSNGEDKTSHITKRLTAASISNRNTNRYSVTALYSMAAEQDVEVEDDLARGELRSCCCISVKH